MQKVEHNFLPLSISHHHILNWSSNTHQKSTINYYYKSLEGYSEVSFENKCQYKGQIRNGLLHGKGIFMWQNGVIYQGQFFQSKITGNGEIRYPNGSWYRGEVANGKRCGKGVYYTTVENYTYEGDWKQGMKHGKGKILYNDKSEYTGQFINDMRQGYGKMTYCTKNSYEGQWKNNKKQGKGTMIWLNNGQKCSNEADTQTYVEKYTGSWKQDKQDGYGEYYWYENKTQFKIFKNVYKGYWKMGKRQGFGMFLYAGGCRFEGYFVDDNKNGVSVIIDECGIAKVMNYLNNKPIHIQSQAQSQPKLQKQTQQQIKLPPIQSHHSKQTSSLSSHLPPTQETHSNKEQSISILSQSNTNEYKKYIDFSHPEINQNFYNMLLRQNTRLKNLYKNMCTLSINWNKEDRREEKAGTQEDIRGYYSGLLLQGFWAVIRDSKVIDQVLSVVELDRMFYQGKRSMFGVNLPDQHIIKAYEECKDDHGIQYEDILWLKYFKELQKVSLNWQVLRLQKNPKCKLKLQAITKGKDMQIHNPQNIILFRHLICLIIRIAILQSHSQEQSQSSLKQRVEALITIFENYVDSSIKIDKQKQKEKFKNSQPSIPFYSNTASNFKNNVCLIGVPEWARIANLELFNAVESQVRYIDGRVDWSVTVRKMYSVLQIGGVFKDFNQKISFLEKMEKCLNVKNSLLKKQIRNIELQKIIKQNINMNYLLNIELTQSQCHQILYQSITKKLSTPPNSPSSPTLIQSYKKQLGSIIEKIKKNYLIQISETKIKQNKLLQRVNKDWRKALVDGIGSVKDQAKKQYLLNLEELKNKEMEKMREFMKEQMKQKERQRMKMEDVDIKSGASDRFSQLSLQHDD